MGPAEEMARLSERLGLIDEPQDWGIVNGDAQRLEEFCAIYASEPLSGVERAAMAELVLASANERLVTDPAADLEAAEPLFARIAADAAWEYDYWRGLDPTAFPLAGRLRRRPQFEAGVHRCDDDPDAARERLEAEGWQVFTLPSGIHHKADFIEALREVLPLDPPLEGCGNWDAASDSVWGGLDAAAERRIAIVWPESRVMETRSPADFTIALEILRDLATSLADPEATLGSPTQLHVALL